MYDTAPLRLDAKPSISFRDVTFAHGRTPVINGFKLDVLSHGVTALLGHSGAGKSTLMALMAGALKPGGGEVLLGGAPPTRTSIRRLIGFMPQLGGLYGDLSVEENLEVFAAGAEASAAGMQKTLELVQLELRRRQPVRELSAGHQQRVSLAAALVGSPSYLLLDEPFAHADAEFADRLWKHFHDLAVRGRTVVIATAHPEVAAKADTVALVRNGRLHGSYAVQLLEPEARGRVVLHFKEKGTTRHEETEVEDYRRELITLISEATPKPLELEIHQESVVQRLSTLLAEDA